jgi:hypothetical protein
MQFFASRCDARRFPYHFDHRKKSRKECVTYCAANRVAAPPRHFEQSKESQRNPDNVRLGKVRGSPNGCGRVRLGWWAPRTSQAYSRIKRTANLRGAALSGQFPRQSLLRLASPAEHEAYDSWTGGNVRRDVQHMQFGLNRGIRRVWRSDCKREYGTFARSEIDRPQSSRIHRIGSVDWRGDREWRSVEVLIQDQSGSAIGLIEGHDANLGSGIVWCRESRARAYYPARGKGAARGQAESRALSLGHGSTGQDDSQKKQRDFCHRIGRQPAGNFDQAISTAPYHT